MNRLVHAGLISLFLCCVFGLGLFGCSSTPEPKPDEGAIAEAEKKPSEEESIAPLTEEDRDAAKSPESKPEEGKEEVVEVARGDSAEELPELGEETSQLLASAAELAQSDPVQAMELVEKSTQDNPKCFQCFYNLGVLLEAESRFSRAIEAYRKALSVHPAHLQSVINLSNLYVRQGSPAKAQSIVSVAVRAAPRDLALRNQLAAVLLSSRKREEASEQAKGVLAVDERNVQAMTYLGQAYYEWGKFELAERILLKAKDIDETNATIQNRLGFVYLKMGNTNSAIASFKKAVELDPSLSEALNNLGVLYSKAHDYTAATEHLRKAVALAPDFFEAYLNLGNALRGDKHFKEAEEAYKKAREVKPGERSSGFNLGLLYLDDEVPGYEKSKRFSMAVEQLEKFKKAGGNHPKLAAYLEEARKKHERAVKSELRKKKREEEKRRKEEEERKKAEAEAKAKAEAEAKARAEAEAKEKAEAEARERAEAEAEAEAKAKAKARAEAEAKARAEAEAKAKAEAEAKAKAEKEASPAGKKLGGGKDEEEEDGEGSDADGAKVGGDEK